MEHHLLGLYDSPYVRRVAITMAHYGIPFTHESLSVFRNVPEMQLRNPLLRVPMLVTPQGEKLHESAFILDYLDALARDTGREALIPAGGAARRRIWQATAVAQTATDKAVAIVYELRRPQPLRWDEWLSRLRGQMLAAFDELETSLHDHWLAAERFSHADVMAAVAVGFVRYTIAGEWPAARYPRIEALAARLEGTNAFTAVPIDRL